jgi:integrative and conjugative element protein (TIGR02256 family)
MRYIIADDLFLEFTNDVLFKFKKYRQFGNREEAGGILLGKVFETKVVVDMITTPSFWDKASKLSFTRNVSRAQKIVNLAWACSSGERIYLGEWHTHPVFKPTPSPDDKKLILNMLKDTRMEIDFLFLVIVGLGEEDLYVGYQKNDILRKLNRLF